MTVIDSRRMSVGKWSREIGWRHLVGIVMIGFALLPLMYIVSVAFKPGGSLTGSNQLFSSISLDNFRNLTTNPNAPYPVWWLNTMKLATMNTVAATFISLLAAYAFSRMRFRGRRQGLITIVLIQMFPQLLAVVAVFVMLDAIGDVFPGIGIGTLFGLLLVYLGGALGMITYLLYGSFNAIPRELDEAARLDGAGHFRIFFSILLPLCRPLIAVVALLVFLSTVGEYGIASIVLTTPEVKTVAVGLTQFVAGSYSRNSDWGIFAAGSLLVALPVLIMFFVLQRHIVSGITSGSIK